jgi:hypothetical protein
MYTHTRNIKPTMQSHAFRAYQGREHKYDKEKYREMLLEAAESILGYFGFDRTVYGDRKKNRKWWYQLRDERRKDIEIERDVHDG